MKRFNVQVIVFLCFLPTFLVCGGMPAAAMSIDEPSETFSGALSNEDTLLLSHPLDNLVIEKINAVNRLFDSLDIVISAGNAIEEARIRAALANHFRLTGNYHESVRFYQEAMNAASQSSHEDRSAIHHGIASAYYEMYFHNTVHSHYLDSAGRHAAIAYALASEVDNSELIADALSENAK